MGNVTGLEFLHKIFYISQGIMLSQIREIAGIDGSTLQNWTKRGWVANAKLKKYSMEQLARILIINMLRDCMQLDRIVFVLRYLNGDEKDGQEARIVSESELYDYLCLLIEHLAQESVSEQTLHSLIDSVLADYREPFGGAKLRLCRALEIFIIAYAASSMKKQADALYVSLISR